MCGSGRLLEGERFICKIYGKKYICRWAVQALHLQGGQSTDCFEYPKILSLIKLSKKIPAKFSYPSNSSQIDELGNLCLKGQRCARCHSCREVSMATLEYGNHPNERPLTGTITLKISRNNLPEKILTLVTKCKRGREEREQESAMIRNR